MCGIIGCLPPAKINLEYLLHRGPDSNDIVQTKDVSMGHVRLSILDLTDRGQQPRWSLDENVLLSFNGEIYNYKAFSSQSETSDTYALVEWLADTDTLVDLSKLDGMYAFAAYYKREKCLLLARDPVGIKPLYIAVSDDTEFLAFSSEIKGFFGLEWFSPTPNLNFDIQKDFLQYGYSYPQQTLIKYKGQDSILPLIPTLVKNVYQICPGQLVTVNKDSEITCNFTKLPERKSSEPVDLLKESIKEQSISDVEIGVQISGGIDSSLVAYFYAKENPLVHGFYVSIPHPDLNEDKWVYMAYERISKVSDFKFHQIDATPDAILNILPSAVWFMDEPMIRHPNALGVFLLCKYVRENTKVEVLLTGEGADEIFGGYSWHNDNKIENYDYNRIIYNFGGSNFIKKDLSAFPEKRILERQLYFDRKYYLPPILLRQDHMSMAHSIEARVPFLSNKFLQMPVPLYAGKRDLKQAAKQIFGGEFAERQKNGFGFPLEWFNEFPVSKSVLSWLGFSIKPKTPFQKWCSTALSLWAEQYLFNGWKNFTNNSPYNETYQNKNIKNRLHNLQAKLYRISKPHF